MLQPSFPNILVLIGRGDDLNLTICITSSGPKPLTFSSFRCWWSWRCLKISKRIEVDLAVRQAQLGTSFLFFFGLTTSSTQNNVFFRCCQNGLKSNIAHRMIFLTKSHWVATGSGGKSGDETQCTRCVYGLWPRVRCFESIWTWPKCVQCGATQWMRLSEELHLANSSIPSAFSDAKRCAKLLNSWFAWRRHILCEDTCTDTIQIECWCATHCLEFSAMQNKARSVLSETWIHNDSNIKI